MRRIVYLSRIKSSLSPDWSLDAAEVETRRIQYGINDIVESQKNRWLELAIDTIKDPMIWFLIAASLLFAFLKNYNQAIILFLATLPLIGMDAFLHWRTQVSTQGLSSRLASKAIVIRNNQELTISVWEIVPGDLIVVPAGTPFPADGIIVAGKNLQVDESVLTGEAFPVKKEILAHLPSFVSDPAVESHYWGFAGTRLLTGRALLRVVFTGQETLYGEIITSALQTTDVHTPLQRAIARLVFALIIAATTLCIILALVRYYQGFGVIDAILSAATLAVAALPDEFPVVFTFFLGVGVYRLACRKALVKRAVSVENIGRITYICVDKTGTITEGIFKLARYYPAKEFNDETLLSIASYASRMESGDLLDLAILNETAEKKLIIKERLATFPYTEERKRETAITNYNENEFLAATKGAPEIILSLSTLTEEEKQNWLQNVEKLASDGYKVLACAQCLLQKTQNIYEPMDHYQFVGLLAFADPPRDGIKEAIKYCYENNIHVLMITGDHPETAYAIGREIGLGQDDPNVVIAEELMDKLKKDGGSFLRTIDIIARAIPSEKFDIVSSLQRSGEIVAVTGDGVNDVPALKVGDIGIAMGERGTQSAREVADIILMDDNFDSIVNAIAEGKQLFKNLQLSFKYLLMIHIPFVFSAAIIPLLGYPLLYHPIHIVLIELIIHPTSLLVFQDLPQFKKTETGIKKTKNYFFSTYDWIKIVVIGTLASIFVILSFILSLRTGLEVQYARALSIGMLCFGSAAITAALSGLKTGVSQVIIISTIIFSVFSIQFSQYVKFLDFMPLRLSDWAIIVAINVLIFVLSLNFNKGKYFFRSQ